MKRRTGSRPRSVIDRSRGNSGGSWISIEVELVEGRGEPLWPRPGRLFAASRTHSFAQLATAIDDAFARWDRSHLHEFELGNGTRIGVPDPDFDFDRRMVDERKTKLSRLSRGERFIYVFDLGDDWAHLCTVRASAIDPIEALGVIPGGPLPYFGWGDIPDQYGRAWSGDDGESQPPPDPQLQDLPRLRPNWGPAG